MRSVPLRSVICEGHVTCVWPLSEIFTQVIFGGIIPDALHHSLLSPPSSSGLFTGSDVNFSVSVENNTCNVVRYFTNKQYKNPYFIPFTLNMQINLKLTKCI